jgi:hypothetical protein
MKKLMYLLVAGSLSVFAACGGASTTEGAAADVAVEEVATDVAVEEVAEAAGCQVEGGTCLADHSCCAPKAAAEESHGDHEGHDHE